MMKRFLLGGVGVVALAAAAAALASPLDRALDTMSGTTVSKQEGRKPARAGGGTLRLGELVTSQLGGGTHTYTLQASEGQRLRMTLSSDDFDTVLRITGPNGFAVENDDEPGGTLNSRIDARLPATGTYQVTVASYGGNGSGAYRLNSIDPANPVPAGAEVRQLALGASLTGMLTPGDPQSISGQNIDYYRFTGHAGERVTFDLGSDQIDTLLTLFLPDGSMEEHDDIQGLDNTNSRLSITLPADGTYTLGASSFGRGVSGPYTIAASVADPNVRTIRPASGNARVFALSVGVSEYERINTLTRTDEDALRVNHALAENGMLAPQSVTLVDGQATRANFQSALTNLTHAMGPDDTLLIFFSGHGDKVEGLTTERDGSAETIELFDAALYDYELADMLSDFDGRLLLVIDACFSGGFDNVIDQHDERMGVFSSDADTLSLVAQGDKAGGYISYIFRQALEGAADLDQDRAIGAGELGEYMRREFYRTVLETPLATDAEDFRDHQVQGWQHIIVDRGGDGMPFQQVLMNYNSVSPRQVARAN
ncbi:MAG: pre-peptidase C-terminal domain-containing protein [Erythrobacter sp.]|nr:pre-peptidase C-terminal domain-containing protein [Erythrobacter sp.]